MSIFRLDKNYIIVILGLTLCLSMRTVQSISLMVCPFFLNIGITSLGSGRPLGLLGSWDIQIHLDFIKFHSRISNFKINLPTKIQRPSNILREIGIAAMNNGIAEKQYTSIWNFAFYFTLCHLAVKCIFYVLLVHFNVP